MKRPLIRQFDYSIIRLFAAFALCAASAVASAMPLGLRLSAQAAAKGAAEKDPMLLTEAEAYERYAPDTAYVVNVEAGDYVNVQLISWVGGTTASDKWVDWGDGTREVVTAAIPKHTYVAAGNYVVRISSNCTWFRAGWYTSGFVGHKYIVRVLRFGDNVNVYQEMFTSCARATCFPDGKLPRWSKAAASVKSFSDVYRDCTSLAPTSLPDWPSGLTSIGNVYSGCTSLAPTSLPDWPSGLTSIGNVYWDCTSLAPTSLPDWPDSCEYIGNVFRQCPRMAVTKLPAWPKSLKKLGDGGTRWYGVYWRCYAIKADKIPEWPEGLTSATGVYVDCPGITGSIHKWPANATKLNYIYYNCTALAATSLPAWPTTLQQANATFQNCTSLAATNVPDWSVCTALTSAEGTYQNCRELTGEVPAWPPNLTRAGSTFEQCAGLTGTIKAWPSTLTQAWWTFYGCKSLTGAWTSDPAELMPTNITSHSECVGGASDAVRELFYSDWGGSREKTE